MALSNRTVAPPTSRHSVVRMEAVAGNLRSMTNMRRRDDEAILVRGCVPAENPAAGLGRRVYIAGNYCRSGITARAVRQPAASQLIRLIGSDRRARHWNRRPILTPWTGRCETLSDGPESEREPVLFAGSAHIAVFTSVLPIVISVVRTSRADVKIAVGSSHRIMLLRTPHLQAVRTRRPEQATAMHNRHRESRCAPCPPSYRYPGRPA